MGLYKRNVTRWYLTKDERDQEMILAEYHGVKVTKTVQEIHEDNLIYGFELEYIYKDIEVR